MERRWTLGLKKMTRESQDFLSASHISYMGCSSAGEDCNPKPTGRGKTAHKKSCFF